MSSKLLRSVSKFVIDAFLSFVCFAFESRALQPTYKARY
ncbi:hypothetical protein ACPOL_1864 [Acidisarcina polymorpha]|uniref:Uncharacterized protein n=1 Tax=Acidisarcina polymorpha TaxID=2211140 RepID=A0A2Z5FXH3_9BACT|nr:hypothetical protein ACPOL_1864 [Acidisarcina polymorpha]